MRNILNWLKTKARAIYLCAIATPMGYTLWTHQPPAAMDQHMFNLSASAAMIGIVVGAVFEVWRAKR